MPVAPIPVPSRLERFPAHAWLVAGVVALSVCYALLEVTVVRPHLWPAGTAATFTADQTSRFPLIARPPDVRQQPGASTVLAVAELSEAALRAVRPGTELVKVRAANGAAVDVRLESSADASSRLDAWRSLYWLGVRGPVVWTVRDAQGREREIALDRISAWRVRPDGWARLHLGMMIQVMVLAGGAVALLLLRHTGITASLCVLALALSAVGGGGPLFGAEAAVTGGRILTVFAWIATPLAFPVAALSILYFPAASPLVQQHRWLPAVPFIVSAPMLGPSLLTALYLAGLDSARSAALWDATHPGVYQASFAAALVVALLAIGEGLHRYRRNQDANERRRIRMAVYTGVPGVIAYAIKDGLPAVARLAGSTAPHYPVPLLIVLQAMVLLPAFGLTYAVGVAHVLGPRRVLRRSLQYALASRTLTIVATLPALALVLSLVRDRGRTITEIFLSRAGVYVVLIAILVAALRYRERARQWLDLKFFREEYDARTILLSLAERVGSETDPAGIARMIVEQIDAALHPDMVAILVSGVEDGQLIPVMVLHGSADALPADGGIAGMLRWSDTPLDILLQDPRSPVRRLPPDEQEWLACTGAALLVPVSDRERTLIGTIVLGERRSEEAYTDEDRQLLASIAAQMGMGFDVARLRRRVEQQTPAAQGLARLATPGSESLHECPTCGRCEEGAVNVCPADGSAMYVVAGVPRTVDGKYRIEQLLGRGGMGAVFRARDLRLERRVALKVVRTELLGDPGAALRFQREAQIVARLQHPSVVAVFDYGTLPGGSAYLVMELVQGEDLRRLLQRQGRLGSGQALRILDSVCAGIEAAHRQGVLHRDLKPENILLPEAGGQAKVLDFGVAKVMTAEHNATLLASAAPTTLLTAPGLIVGTPAYMAPEQFNLTPGDARTDVFSLGVIAYEMLAGTLPFGRGPLGEVVLAHMRGAPPMPKGVVAIEVESAILKALDADPDRRPASAQAFARLVGSAMDA